MDTTGVDLAGVLYGDVTLSWQPAPPSAAAVGAGPQATAPPGSVAHLAMTGHEPPTATDLVLAARDPAGEGAHLFLASAPRMLSDGSWEYVLGIEQADGIVALDLVLEFDPKRVRVVGIDTTDLGSSLALVSNTGHAAAASIALWGVEPLQGTGELLVVRARLGRGVTGFPFRIEAQANESRIPLDWGLDLEPVESPGRLTSASTLQRR
jgi:hypothetical protein